MPRLGLMCVNEGLVLDWIENSCRVYRFAGSAKIAFQAVVEVEWLAESRRQGLISI